jgi:hypothetical protein
MEDTPYPSGRIRERPKFGVILFCTVNKNSHDLKNNFKK